MKVVTSLMQQYLSSEYSALQKVVSDLSCRIDKLQAQELGYVTKHFKSFRKASRFIKVPGFDQKSSIVGVNLNKPYFNVRTAWWSVHKEL